MRMLLLATHLVLAVAALGAGQAFVRDPSGSALGMSKDWLRNSPFPDFWFPGLFLATVIAGANAVSAAMLWRRHRLGPLVSLGTGLLLLAWIAIQTAILGFRHWSQAVWWATFTGVIALALGLRRGRAG